MMITILGIQYIWDTISALIYPPPRYKKIVYMRLDAQNRGQNCGAEYSYCLDAENSPSPEGAEMRGSVPGR